MAAPFSQQLHLAQQKQNYTNKKMTTPFSRVFQGFVPLNEILLNTYRVK